MSSPTDSKFGLLKYSISHNKTQFLISVFHYSTEIRFYINIAHTVSKINEKKSFHYCRIYHIDLSKKKGNWKQK